MANCEFLESCAFFNDRMSNMPSTSEIIKLLYCQDKSSDCARFLVREAIGKDGVPDDLFPNHREEADIVISRGR